MRLPGLCVPIPGKIICVGLNYRRHALETGATVPATPVIFGKFNNALVASGQTVRLPSTAAQYDYEAELGVVIGRRAVAVSEGDALDYVCAGRKRPGMASMSDRCPYRRSVRRTLAVASRADQTGCDDW